MEAHEQTSTLGVVVIGRNEGERLRNCLKSISAYPCTIVYVDSGSTDNSLEIAREYDCLIVELDLSKGFTAARARNAGFRHLIEQVPTTERVQFVDGDCMMSEGWLAAANKFLTDNPQAAVVCGRRRELYPDNSIYNLLCDIEWDTPIGNTKSCGGDALMRVDAFQQVEGYRDSIVAGEEPELCVRLRKAGWEIWRIDQEMTLHDAAITQFRQWWKRVLRSGHAYAEGMYLHGEPPERHCVRDTMSALAWGGAIPLMILCLAVFAHPIFLVMFGVYGLQVWRCARHGKRAAGERWVYAFFIILGKIPESQGVMKFYLTKLFNRRSRIIEYK